MNHYYKVDPCDPDYDPEVEHPSIDESLDEQALVAEELWREEKTNECTSD